MSCDDLCARQGENFSAVINWLPSIVGEAVDLGVNATIGRFPNFFTVPATIIADAVTPGQYDIVLSEVSANTGKWVEGANKLSIDIIDVGTQEVIYSPMLIVHVRSAQNQS